MCLRVRSIIGALLTFPRGGRVDDKQTTTAHVIASGKAFPRPDETVCLQARTFASIGVDLAVEAGGTANLPARKAIGLLAASDQTP
jgi:hypothetical protein